ncbi:hypothetical protein GYMLUDRAFT_208995 [Collybiopsis luxurians FD-317 M1]|uniref:Glucose-methanol-choline oxidoreductase N-terminal domain-containing protein n=1 Tax=Collybiopsis luxurians FD-317 M1 TaxID=944289 RepID=A0A0D0B993_9AGAR|nr:hypothetical protein GYMLUDRAFT_208995 [Collybiopsis luxurians FD-317 M1]
MTNWNYSTIPQPGALNQSLLVSSGFVLGGSSSINTLNWYRASNDFWDNVARIAGDDGWSWKSVERYYFKTSQLVAPQDGRNIASETDSLAHGDGPINVTVNGYVFDIDTVFEEAARKSTRFPYNPDYNSGNTLGIGWAQSSIGGGKRNSAVTAYLEPALNRSNLDVLVNTRASKLFSSSMVNGRPLVNVVELTSSPNGPRVNVTATKEIILSAGAIGTPQILLLSGIGPKADLNTLNIDVVADSSAVGLNLTDQPGIGVIYNVTSVHTFNDVLRNSTLATQHMQEWMNNRTGLFANYPGSIVGNFKLPSTFEDHSSGPGSANIGIVTVNAFLGPPPETGEFISLLVAVLSPTSRGSVKLASKNPFEPPLIDFGVFTNDYDLKAQVEALKIVDEVLSLPEFNGIILGPYSSDLADSSEEQKVEYVRRNVNLYDHASCSASMGPEGVVDSALKVRGVEGLRIVDASIFPKIPESNTQAPVYIVAEKAADLIKADYRNPTIESPHYDGSQTVFKGALPVW